MTTLNLNGKVTVQTQSFTAQGPKEDITGEGRHFCTAGYVPVTLHHADGSHERASCFARLFECASKDGTHQLEELVVSGVFFKFTPSGIPQPVRLVFTKPHEIQAELGRRGKALVEKYNRFPTLLFGVNAIRNLGGPWTDEDRAADEHEGLVQDSANQF